MLTWGETGSGSTSKKPNARTAEALEISNPESGGVYQ